MTQKILLKNDFLKERNILDQIENSITVINEKLVPELEKIGFTLTDDVLKDCLSGAKKLRAEYDKAIKNDLAKVQLPSTRLRIEEEANEAFTQFSDKLTEFRRDIKQEKFIAIVDGSAVLTDEAKAQVNESCNVYLTDPKQIEVFEHLKEACKHLNAVFPDDLPMWWNQVFAYTEKAKFHPNPDMNLKLLGGF